MSFLQWDERDVFDGYCFHPQPNRTVDQFVDVSISQRRRNLEVFSVVSDALISPDWSRPIHCTGRHHALVMGPCIWVLISYIQQGRQSHAHASSTTRSILSYYSSEIPRVLSTSDEMSITQMRRLSLRRRSAVSMVYGVGSEPSRLVVMGPGCVSTYSSFGAEHLVALCVGHGSWHLRLRSSRLQERTALFWCSSSPSSCKRGPRFQDGTVQSFQ